MRKIARSVISSVALLLALFLFSPAHPILAADITVDSNCSLADAIRAAESDSETGGCQAGSDADTIYLTGDVTLAAELPQIASVITIEGGGYTISGDSSFRIFTVAEGALTLNHLTVTNGSAEEGGAIYNEGVLKISDSRFWNNAVEYDGGAIFSEGTLSVKDSIFVNNRAGLGGGAIANDGALVISNSRFSDNSSRISGGAIVDYAELTISSSRFSNNSSGLSGGAIASVYQLNITSSIFTGNTAEGSGGALSTLVGDSKVIDSKFLDNSAAKGGGAIENDGAYGGPYGRLIVTGSAFSGNRSTIGSGGAISSTDHNTLSIANSSFSNNRANLAGGAVSSFGELNISDSTFAGNLAESRAGAILVFSASTATLAHLTVVNNLSSEGGGIFVWHEDTVLDVYNSLIFGNDGGDCNVQLNHNSGNLIADGACDPDFQGDPMLGALVESEDGSPSYYPLLPDSPAIDAADPDFCTDTDQTGTARPQGDGCDIGAIEHKHD